MRSLSVTDEAWAYCKQVQVRLMKETGKVQTINDIASKLILKGGQ